ncbi:unnamed protein product [Lactuca virosa]|uniref:Uncharacterized protein n=1 Tax=Lactuca virosa TaxID=75947 RepID=A0AAU9NJH8_9ASTR|nr:unnamed protein product [Lactuca virosa]
MGTGNGVPPVIPALLGRLIGKTATINSRLKNYRVKRHPLLPHTQLQNDNVRLPPPLPTPLTLVVAGPKGLSPPKNRRSLTLLSTFHTIHFVIFIVGPKNRVIFCAPITS